MPTYNIAGNRNIIPLENIENSGNDIVKRRVFVSASYARAARMA